LETVTTNAAKKRREAFIDVGRIQTTLDEFGEW
jgi:hypothetical protein